MTIIQWLPGTTSPPRATRADSVPHPCNPLGAYTRGQGNLRGRLELPMKVGIVGGPLESNPGVAMNMRLLGPSSIAHSLAFSAQIPFSASSAADAALTAASKANVGRATNAKRLCGFISDIHRNPPTP